MFNNKDDLSDKTLILSIESGNNVFSEALIMQGMGLNAKDDNGCTPLIIAIKKKNKYIACRLINANDIDLEAIDNDGFTALDWAERNKLKNVAEKLIEVQKFHKFIDSPVEEVSNVSSSTGYSCFNSANTKQTTSNLKKF